MRKIGKSEDNRCLYCKNIDAPDHTLFHCERWKKLRTQFEEETGMYPTKDNIGDIMMRTKKELVKTPAQTKKYLTVIQDACEEKVGF